MNLFALIAIPILIIINALFVAVEYALVAVRRTRIEELVKCGVSGAKSVESALASIERSIAATQLGITLASIALGAIGEPTISHLIEPLFAWLPMTFKVISKHSIATAFAILFITLFHVILGEQFPKMAALQSTERTVLWLTPALILWSRICSPILRLMNAISTRLLRLAGFSGHHTSTSIHSIQELRLIIEDTQEAGLIEKDQSLYLQNIFTLTNRTVGDCMVAVDKMDAIETKTPLDQILQVVRDSGHTRMPVYDTTRDNIIGILNTKHLFYYLSLGSAFILEDAIYPPTFLDPGEKISRALRLFRKSRRPMAMVRDKAGHILGLITLEDILEEIVGDIEDEHDAIVPRVKPNSSAH